MPENKDDELQYMLPEEEGRLGSSALDIICRCCGYMGPPDLSDDGADSSRKSCPNCGEYCG